MEQWIAASAVLGRPVAVTDPYPHICRHPVAAGKPDRLTRRDCPACATTTAPTQRPEPPAAERPQPMTTVSLLDSALSYAARGWHVFPLRPDDKRPAFPDHTTDTCTGRDPRCRAAGRHVGWEARATTDPHRIRRAWTTADYNIGIACGPSNLVVVDLDAPKPGQTAPPEWANQRCATGDDVFDLLSLRHGDTATCDTYTVTTGRGGTHLYYQHPDHGPRLRNTSGERGNGLGWLIDTRAHGGYVVAAGSTVAGNPYTLTRDTEVAALPGWIAERLRPDPLPEQRPVVVDLPAGRTGAYVNAAIGRQLDHLRQATEGERNRALYVSAVALGQLAAGGALDHEQAAALLEEAALSIGLTRLETLRTIRSGLAAGARRPRTVAA